jgi:RNA polymerase sigma-70 factor (ECF subfamily)
MFTSALSGASAADRSGNPLPRSATHDRVAAEGDDEKLIRRVAAGDEDAFRALYGRHTGAVYGTLCRLVGRPSDAADLMQEAWLRAVRHLSLFRGQSAFRTWLTGIALNCYREWRRKHSREVLGTDADVRPWQVASGDEIAAINQVLGQLPYEHREAIVLHDIEGFTHEEIAAALEIEPGTSKSRLSRARRAFRERWQGAR